MTLHSNLVSHDNAWCVCRPARGMPWIKPRDLISVLFLLRFKGALHEGRRVRVRTEEGRGLVKIQI